MTEKLQYSGVATVGQVRWLTRIVRGCETATNIALAAMVSIIVVDVLTRNFFDFSLQISDEVCGYMLVASTFLAMPVSLANDALHKVHFLEDRFGEYGRLGLHIGVGILSLAVCFIVEWQLVRFTFLSFRSGSVAMTDLGTPLWIPQAVMPIGFGFFCIALAATIVMQIARLRGLAPAACHSGN